MQHIFFATEGNMGKNIKHYTETIYYEMEQTAKIMRMMAVQFCERLKNGLMPAEYVALDIIICNDGICQRDLAKLMLKDRAATGRLVESLEKKGLVSRSVDTKNNRLVRKLSVTKDGLNIVHDITGKIKKHLEETSKIVTESEIEKLKDGIRAFRVSLEKLIELKI